MTLTITAQARPVPVVEGVTSREVGARGVRFHVAEAGAGEPLVLLHGFPQHWYAWRHVVPLLAPHARLVMPDLRGSGWTDAPPGGYDSATRVDDLLALLDALGLERVWLAGHDWGARTGFLACLRAPELFGGFLALNAVHPWPGPLRSAPHAWRYAWTTVLETPGLGAWALRRPGFTRALLRMAVADPGVWTEGELDEFATATAEPARARAAAALHRNYARHDLLPLLLGRHRSARLAVPTLLLGGVADRMLAPAVLGGGECHADELRVRLVPGAGHQLPDERPDVVAAAARELFGL
jgi:pimeloyl-ACP methyl ester carboxylesterase